MWFKKKEEEEEKIDLRPNCEIQIDVNNIPGIKIYGSYYNKYTKVRIDFNYWYFGISANELAKIISNITNIVNENSSIKLSSDDEQFMITANSYIIALQFERDLRMELAKHGVKK